MEKAKLIMTFVSLVFVNICLVGSAWMYFSLPTDNADRMFFGVCAIIFVFASLWFGLNTYNLIRSRQA